MKSRIEGSLSVISIDDNWTFITTPDIRSNYNVIAESTTMMVYESDATSHTVTAKIFEPARLTTIIGAAPKALDVEIYTVNETIQLGDAIVTRFGNKEIEIEARELTRELQ